MIDKPNNILQGVLALMMFALVSCASPADPAAMIPKDAVVRKSHQGSVDLSVGGGRDTNPMGVSQVSNEDFRQAVEASILRYGVFSRVIQNNSADYHLEVILSDLKQPMAGFDMTVTADVSWRLLDVRSGRIIWQQTITSHFTATVGDAFAGVHRLQLANEGAIRESIKAGLSHIAELPF